MKINWTLAGQAERREIFDESDEIVALKTHLGIFNDLNFILCIGELFKDREAGKFLEITVRQLEAVYKNIKES